jgi:tRNA nucleotidyltransferase (CCA-adding enzyme)
VPNPKKTLQPDTLRSRLKAKISESVWKLFEVAVTCADDLKMDVYLVGGCIRDLLLGTETLDWDIVVQGDGPELGAAIAAKFDGEIQKKSQFLTCTVILENENKLDIATTRSEIYKHPAALPEVQKSSIDEDLFRRDFTVNTLALKLNGEDAFTLIDKYNGLKDLNAGLIKILHSKSFLDDPTRAFRAIRYEKRFGFSLQSETNQLLKEAINAKVFDRLSGFRIFNELKRTLQEKQPASYVQRYKEIGLLQCIHPDLFDPTSGTELLNKIEKGLHHLKDLPENWKVYFLGMLYSTPKESRQPCLSRLDLKGKEADFFRESIDKVEKALTALDKTEDIDPLVIYETLHQLSDEAIAILIALAKTEGVKKAIVSYNDNFRERAILKVNGDDLIKLGFSPGPTFQKILENLKKARLTGEIHTKNDEIDWIQKKFNPEKN